MATQKGRRYVSWRDDKPAELMYVEALDEGDPAKEVPYRDQVYTLAAPFQGNGRPLVKTIDRFAGIDFATNEVAFAYDRWFDTRNTRTYTFDPSDAAAEAEVTSSRNYQDRYSDPGDLVRKRNEFGRYVVAITDGKAHLLGDGYTEDGQFPFLDETGYKVGKDQTGVYLRA